LKILLLDIETAPNTAYIWGIFKENIPLARLIDSGYVLCYSAKWLGEEEIFFDSVQDSTTEFMLNGIHTLLDQADAVVHYNGNRFDIPTLNREFLLYGMAPPSPSKHIDLYQVVKRNFRFLSNKLDYVAQQLGLGQKKNTTFELWIGCMENDPTAWEKMEEYNINDVILLENVYYKLLPWIKGHANHSIYGEDSLVCPNCGGHHYHKRGFQFTNSCKYQRYQCVDCGNWFRDTKNIGHKAGEKFVNA
jgi:DNA polymerase elongation subunit (family B)